MFSKTVSVETTRKGKYYPTYFKWEVTRYKFLFITLFASRTLIAKY